MTFMTVHVTMKMWRVSACGGWLYASGLDLEGRVKTGAGIGPDKIQIGFKGEVIIMGTTALTNVILVDEKKCINCYACITACPVKYCTDGSKEKLLINHDLCLGCGHCIHACSHKARLPVDDTAHFFSDLKRKDKMVAIVAPAVVSSFPDAYLRLNGYLKSIGVEAVFDVSFGAELTVLSYLDYIKRENPRLVIAQPCPAIVTFIEIYHPELIPYLAPVDSPMLHSIKMIREYYPQYRDHKVAVISPCIAKRIEFDETKLGDYNITMVLLKKYFETNGISLASFPEEEYEGAPAERAAGFSSPGGLLDTIEKFIPGIRRQTRKIEGVHTVYPYLTDVAKLINSPGMKFPLLIDCLNCEKGCNGGPGTGNDAKPMDELESPVRKRIAKLEKTLGSSNPRKASSALKKHRETVGKYWRPGMYKRDYRDLSGNLSIVEPTENQLTEVYRTLKKYTSKDIYDCTACGYMKCKSMAVAIFNGLNKPEHCTHFNAATVEDTREELRRQLYEQINKAISMLGGMQEMTQILLKRLDEHLSGMSRGTEVAESMKTALVNASNLARKEQESIQGLLESAGKGKESMQETTRSVNDISQSVDGIASAIKIIAAIAANTNLLAMNAAIEAAHAGEAGRGFAVVADEIRRLSETTRDNSRNISQTLSSIIEGINLTSRRSGGTSELIDGMSKYIDGFAGAMMNFIDTLNNLSVEGSVITSVMQEVCTHSDAVKIGYHELIENIRRIKEEMEIMSVQAQV